MSADEFWDSTLAQLVALIPPDPTVAAPKGTSDDLLALAGMQGR